MSRPEDTVSVTVDVTVGDVWIDADGAEFEIVELLCNDAVLRPVAETSVDFRDLVHEWVPKDREVKPRWDR